MPKVTGYTDIYALFGNPVEHSKSPEMYNYTYNELGMDKIYLAFKADEDELERTFDFIRQADIKGGNLTMPVKTKGAELADKLTDSARLIGAVNTFKNEDGVITGHNTDGKGFVDNLRINGYDIKGKNIVLVGCGAAGTAIAVQSVLDGAKSLTIFNQKDRFFDSGSELVAKLADEFKGCNITINDLAEDGLLASKIKDADFLFDATKVGMGELEGESLIKPDLLHSELVVSDTIYNPEETQLIKAAKEARVKAAFNGIGMLLYQGAAAFEFWTGEKMPVDKVRRDVYNL